MNEIKVFENEQFGEIRTVTIDGQPWFVGKDVANALGYNKSRNAIAQHVDDEDKTPALIQGGCSTGTQKTIVINESGLYSLILKSKLPSAKQFKRWVTSEVLPSIRKYGAYATEETLNRVEDDTEEAEKLFRMLREEKHRSKDIANQNEKLITEIHRLNEENTALAEVVDFVSMHSDDGDNLIAVSEIAVAYRMTAVEFNRMLAILGIQYKAYGTWFLVDEYTDRGYTQTDRRFRKNNESDDVYIHTRWTHEGARFLYEFLKLHNILPVYERCK